MGEGEKCYYSAWHGPQPHVVVNKIDMPTV